MRHLIALLLLFASPVAASVPTCEPFRHLPHDERLIEVGRLLFYDPVLSGGREVACATCHHHDHASADGVALGIGDGGVGIGPDRRIDPANPPEQRIPRNAPALFNLGEVEFTAFFHDGRLETAPNGRRTPLAAGAIAEDLPILSAQAMLPLLSPDEMAGHYSENDVATAVRRGDLPAAWSLLAARVFDIPEYAEVFAAAGREESLVAVADALAAFIATEWQATNSAFDRHICEGAALSDEAQAGMNLFYGKAGCADCHAGRFQTDHAYHAIATPQIGPGKAERFESHARDIGRMRVTGREEDAYKFRTPSLRNVALTAPYGHAGAFGSLEEVVRHHLDPVSSLRAYQISVWLPDMPGADDGRVLADAEELDRIAAANELAPTMLNDEEVAAIVAFLHALTDEAGAAGLLGPPGSVPSGLPVP